jgi:hypothetical protein
MKGKIKVKCTKCRETKWVPADIVRKKIERIRKETKRPNAGFRCADCLK